MFEDNILERAEPPLQEAQQGRAMLGKAGQQAAVVGHGLPSVDPRP